ncbi:MAG: hypothetical protein H6868_05365 [Rhodospirillales bacterium]|nr:hypothetical protein [Rhodospirillales bacterium]
MKTAQELQDSLKAQIDFIDDVIARVRSNELVDIRDMEDAVASLSDDIQGAGPQIAPQIEDLLGTMVARLDDLARELEYYQARTTQDNKK